jgi:PAS domain S-box-containing protein
LQRKVLKDINTPKVHGTVDKIRYYAAIILSSEDAIISEDLDGIITSWNRAAEKIFGFSENEAVGKTMAIVGHPDNLFEHKDIIARVKKRLTVERLETQRRAKDGKIIHIAMTISPIWDENSKLIGFLVIDRDITYQKQSSQYARSLIEASPDPLVTISPEGKITDVNEATIKVTGVSREDLIGTDFCDYFTESEKAREGYQLVFSKGIVTDLSLTIRHFNGSLTDVLYNASVYKDIDGNVLGVFAAARDITAQKKAEALVIERLTELEKFHQFTIDRELKMIDLKKEIEELKKKLALI